MNTNIIESLRYGYEAFSRGDIQGAVDALDLSPDILWSEPEDFYAGGTYRGHKGVAEYLTLSYESSEKVQSLPEEILEVGDKIFVLVHFQAWPKGGGQPREGHIADVYTVQDGKIVQMQAYRDPEEARIILQAILASGVRAIATTRQPIARYSGRSRRGPGRSQICDLR